MFGALLAAAPAQSRNPILPSVPELVWGISSFLIVFLLMWKFAFPSVKKGMDARTERIRESLSLAEQAKTDAQSVLDEYQSQMADAKNEANRIIDEARQTAEALRRDLMGRAEADANEVRARATADIEAAKNRALDELKSQLTDLTISLAEKVVKGNIDRASNARLIDEYISSIGQR
ncbi:MAG TPA: F0F1 ATP synthase subunit B [Acidimicrobiales bacterium]|nr:F0F1 ATP synthase subunit B [Acidimicrobiales bacterium]